MASLFDMLNNAQDGRGMDLLARQFNLSQQQTQLAVEALLPAFSQGLKRNASDPYGVANFLQALASGQHAQYFEDQQAAFSPQGIAEGNGILGHLFGSKDLSRAVAAQAAQATGVGQDVLKQMLPVIASMIMGGLFKQSSGQMAGMQAQAASNPLGEIIEQMMRQGGGMGMPGGGGQTRRAPQTEPASPFDNPLGKILEGMLGGGAAAPTPQTRQRQAPPQQQNPMGDNPFGRILEEMLGGGQRRPAPEPEPEEEPEPAPRQRRAEPQAKRQRNPYDDLFGEMFETGRKQRDDYQKGVESIFEQFTKGMDRYR